jgi:uncharacterized protein YjbI with pentapeptide repeats
MSGANLTDALLHEGDFASANLAQANLQGARLGRARLNQANLEGANLVRADLRGARLAGARLKGADMRSVKLDNQNLRGVEKRWVVAFSPRRAWGEGLDKLFELYPGGRMISILRDPLSWFTSAQGRDPEADPEPLVEHWKRSAQEMIDAKQRYPDRVFVVRFDELVRETEGTMRSLADFLAIDFDSVLASPTFNGYPVGANSSFEVRRTGVVTDPVDRYKELLSDEQRERILGECQELHEEALGLVVAA